MGYRHIDNLYKNQTIMLFRECFALEKVHGTSAHVSIKIRRNEMGIIQNVLGEDLTTPMEGEVDKGQLRYTPAIEVTFFSGGASHLQFIELFDVEDLKKRFRELNLDNITVYGEAYGGKMQGMRDTYGDKLQFIAFEVETSDRFLGVESADFFVQKLGLEFVPYRKISTDIDSLNAERDLPSRVAVRRGITEPKISEGVVLRPPIEVGYQSSGASGFGRIIAKHKREEFSERASKKDTQVDPAKLQVLTKAQDIANEWVTPMRLEHVLDKLKGAAGRELGPEDTKAVITAMIEDVTREAKDEIVASKEALKAIGSTTAKLFKASMQKSLEGT